MHQALPCEQVLPRTFGSSTVSANVGRNDGSTDMTVG